MSNVDELYKQSEQFRREGKNDEAIAKLNEVLQADGNHGERSEGTFLRLSATYSPVLPATTPW